MKISLDNWNAGYNFGFNELIKANKILATFNNESNQIDIDILDEKIATQLEDLSAFIDQARVNQKAKSDVVKSRKNKKEKAIAKVINALGITQEELDLIIEK